jgi:cell division GTPase FtsZ
MSSTPSLNLVAVGLGQAGGWLAAEWRRRGYAGVVLNTAASDLRGLEGNGIDVDAADLLDIGLDGADGAGRDPSFGGRCVRTHADAIVALVRARSAGADALVLMAGLGGGTGSAVVDLIDVLQVLDLPMIVVATLPSAGESGIAQVNAARAIDGIVRANVAGHIFVDNGRLLEAFPGVDVVSYFQKVNARVLQPLDELNRLNARADFKSLKTFDGEDLRKVLLSSGSLLVHTARLREGVLAASDLLEVVDKAVDGGDLFAKGSSIDTVAYAAVLVSGPEKVLKTTPMQVFEDLAVELKKRTNGGAAFDGLYVSGDDQPLRCWVLLSSLGMPRRVLQLVERAAADGAALAKKIARDVPVLDVGVLDGLSLFRGSRGAGSLPPMPATSSMAANTSLPPMPVRAPAPSMLDTPLPVTATREAVPSMPRRAPAPTELLSVVDVDVSRLPSLLEPGALLPPPGLDNSSIPGLSPGVPQVGERTMEGEPPGTAVVDSLLVGPHAEMESAVARYKGGDKKTKERIGRKWLEDSRDQDLQVRLLAVMAMVQVQDGAFRRALTRCSNDDNGEIARLAIAGLDALGDVPGVD